MLPKSMLFAEKISVRNCKIGIRGDTVSRGMGTILVPVPCITMTGRDTRGLVPRELNVE